jgi:N-acetylglucosaminyldiphosphoundecaprenol N-acetyl-beta-D-mannosaminyltransferase
MKSGELSVLVGKLPINVYTYEQLKQTLIIRHGLNEGSWIVTANLDIVRILHMGSNLKLLESIRKSALITADGAPVATLASLMQKDGVERVTGSDLIQMIPDWLSHLNPTIVLAGGPFGHAQEASVKLKSRFPRCQFHSIEIDFAEGPSSQELEDLIIQNPKAIVFLGLGAPKQEIFIQELQSRHAEATFLGCGAAISFAAGKISRAPIWVQNGGIEWLYRFFLEPGRLFSRYFVRDTPFLIFQLIPSVIFNRFFNTRKR